MGDPCSHLSHREATVESKALAPQVAPGELVQLEGVEGPVEVGLEVAH